MYRARAARYKSDCVFFRNASNYWRDKATASDKELARLRDEHYSRLGPDSTPFGYYLPEGEGDNLSEGGTQGQGLTNPVLGINPTGTATGLDELLQELGLQNPVNEPEPVSMPVSWDTSEAEAGTT